MPRSAENACAGLWGTCNGLLVLVQHQLAVLHEKSRQADAKSVTDPEPDADADENTRRTCGGAHGLAIDAPCPDPPAHYEMIDDTGEGCGRCRNPKLHLSSTTAIRMTIAVYSSRFCRDQPGYLPKGLPDCLATPQDPTVAIDGPLSKLESSVRDAASDCLTNRWSEAITGGRARARGSLAASASNLRAAAGGNRSRLPPAAPPGSPAPAQRTGTRQQNCPAGTEFVGTQVGRR